ncbi:MAG: GHMP kinase [Dehalococcoidales bacterium]|nr:GHMP kinase [Dehalococcoidales bacterium]
MILSSAPMRITLGGGSTDLKSYYANYGGFLIAAAIDKYVSILANKRFYDSIRLSYMQLEVVDKLDDIKNTRLREALRFTGIDKGIEIQSFADIPANTGLGSSSSFMVAVLNALHAYKREFVTQRQLAEEACLIEIDVLGEPIGKQDQYMAAFGGLTCLTFAKNGEVLVEPLKITEETREQLESNLQYFFTGIERGASEILKEQDTKSRQDEKSMIDNLHQIKAIGLATKKYLERGEVDMVGELFHTHWELKKKRSSKMTNPFIDESYEIARKNGAIGGKLVGAGGGGFLMFYCRSTDKSRLNQAMKARGLKPVRFHFDHEGARILVNMKRD